jgi:molecular chaperone GrpE
MLKDKTELTDAKSAETAKDGQKTKPGSTTELPVPPAGEQMDAATESPSEVKNESPAEDARQAEIEQLKAERNQLVDRLARMQAEFENARKRGERERADQRDYMTGQVVEKFLPVLDNFELALKADGSSEQLRSGVNLILKQMIEVLGKMHVKAIPAVGAEFDPRIHEALGTVERDDVPDQHVAEEIRRGYKMREKLLRPALVRVAHNAKQVSE